MTKIISKSFGALTSVNRHYQNTLSTFHHIAMGTRSSRGPVFKSSKLSVPQHIQLGFSAFKRGSYGASYRALADVDIASVDLAVALDIAAIMRHLGRIALARSILTSAARAHPGVADVSRALKSIDGEPVPSRGQMRLIFDTQYYLGHSQIARLRGIDVHYEEVGSRRGRNPSPLFDTPWYLERNPDVRRQGTNPLVHYVLHGAGENRNPSFWFDTKWYRDTYLRSPGEDDWNPLAHYMIIGREQHFSPLPLFDPKWYLEHYSDVRDAGEEPVSHFINFGVSERRNPNAYFNAPWYMAANPDVEVSGMNALAHYAQFGWREGRSPNPLFDTDWYKRTYLADQPDTEPLAHFIHTGRTAGNIPHPAYDEKFYRNNCPTVEDPYAHYLMHGLGAGYASIQGARDRRDQAVSTWVEANRLTAKRRGILQDRLAIDSATTDTVPLTRFVAALDGVECVSFDVFDTLVERCIGRPSLVFAIVESRAEALGLQVKDFAINRIEAERTARSIAGVREVTLREIYGCLKYSVGLSNELAQQLEEMEIAAELEVCEAKPVGRALFEAAERLGLQVVVVSDSYLPGEVVASILANAGITTYGAIFVSSDTGATKHHGAMFEHICQELKLNPQSVLHVGDNHHSDGVMAMRHGCRSLIIRKSEDFVQNPVLKTWIDADIIGGDRWKGLFAGLASCRNARDRPAAEMGDCAASLRRVGYEGLAPLLLGFAQFVVQSARTHSYERLYFVSRDGFYLKEAYDRVRRANPSLPEASYLLSSRLVGRLAGLTTREGIDEIAGVDHCPMEASRLIEGRFRLSCDKQELACRRARLDPLTLKKVVVDARSDRDFAKILEACAPAILEYASNTRRSYRRYLDEIGFTQGRNAVVDIGYRGTIQRNIASLTGSKPGGIYFSTWPEAQSLLASGLRFDSYIPLASATAQDPLIRYIQLFELLFSATHGTLLDFEMAGDVPKPILADPDTSPATRASLNLIRQTALQTVDDAIRFFDASQPLAQMPGRTMLGPLLHHFTEPLKGVADALADHKFEDAFGGDSRWLVYPKQKQISLQAAREASCWPEATLRHWTGKPRLLQLDDPAPFDRFEGASTIAASQSLGFAR